MAWLRKQTHTLQYRFTVSCLLFIIIPILVIWKAIVLVVGLLKEKLCGTSLVDQWLNCASTARAVGLIPAQGTKIPHAPRRGKKKKKKKTCVICCAITIYLSV